MINLIAQQIKKDSRSIKVPVIDLYEKHIKLDDAGIVDQFYLAYNISRKHTLEINNTEYYWTKQHHIIIWITKKSKTNLIYDGIN